MHPPMYITPNSYHSTLNGFVDFSFFTASMSGIHFFFSSNFLWTLPLTSWIQAVVYLFASHIFWPRIHAVRTWTFLKEIVVTSKNVLIFYKWKIFIFNNFSRVFGGCCWHKNTNILQLFLYVKLNTYCNTLLKGLLRLWPFRNMKILTIFF